MTEKRSETRYRMAREKGIGLFEEGKYGSANIEFRGALTTAVRYSLSGLMIRESAESLYESLIADARSLSQRKQLSSAEERAIEAKNIAREHLDVDKQMNALRLLRELDETPLS